MIDVFGNEIKEEQVEEEIKTKKVSLFDFIGDISYNKQYLFNEETEKQYNIFMVNRGFSQQVDTILLSEEANRLAITDKQMHHDFLFYTVSKKKRYGKWAKSVDIDLVDLVQKKYKVNKNRANEYLSLMNEDDKNNLKQSFNTGGKS